jgi:hypothetical protein
MRYVASLLLLILISCQKEDNPSGSNHGEGVGVSTGDEFYEPAAISPQVLRAIELSRQAVWDSLPQISVRPYMEKDSLVQLQAWRGAKRAGVDSVKFVAGKGIAEGVLWLAAFAIGDTLRQMAYRDPDTLVRKYADSVLALIQTVPLNHIFLEKVGAWDSLILARGARTSRARIYLGWAKAAYPYWHSDWMRTWGRMILQIKYHGLLPGLDSLINLALDRDINTHQFWKEFVLCDIYFGVMASNTDPTSFLAGAITTNAILKWFYWTTLAVQEGKGGKK